jgi:sulfate permease, SulP family
VGQPAQRAAGGLPLVVATVAIIALFPRINQIVPAPLVAIVVVTAVAWVGAIDLPTVSDQGKLPTSLPPFGLPDVPYNEHALSIISVPYALGMALVGLMESLMTAKFVDDITDTRSDKNRESWGQGIANLVTGLFGGMGGCAMIGQTMINVGSPTPAPASPPSSPAGSCCCWPWAT